MKSIVQAVTFAVAFTLIAFPLRAQSVEQGIQLFNDRKYVEAKAVLLAHGERDANAAYYLGRIEMENGDPGNAAVWLERAVRMNPKSAVYYDWLGRAYGRQAQTSNFLKLLSLSRKTKKALETALALDPDNLDVRDALIAYYSRAPAFAGGSKPKARQMLLETRRRNAYRGSLAGAGLCVEEKDFSCAERELRGMLTSYPDSGAVYAALATLYTNQKQFDKAFTLLDERLRTKPNEGTSLYQVGRTASLSGEKLDQGEHALKTYLANPAPEQGPEPAHVHYRLGLIYEKKGAKDLAREEYRAALQLNPRHRDAQKALAALK